MSEKKKVVDTLTLYTDRPTDVSFDDLHNWVIWQFPRKKGNGLCGAVRPPIAEHGWFPALIRSKEERVLIHGEVSEQFIRPETAAEWLANDKSSQ